ncbi:ankyrin repeat-containing domain protein [Aspergillus pseudoustus]|uniref:Ankyrin repeat-containing domain protein n=1 Tax=Aspergillus pseudoustus TaxID=1810923 RepID=A0ABR4J9M7_9EURO
MASPPKLPSEILLLIIKHGVEWYWAIPEIFKARLVSTIFADEILTLLLQTDRIGKEFFYEPKRYSDRHLYRWTTLPERLKHLYLRAKIDQNGSRPCSLSKLVHDYLDSRPSPDRNIQVQQIVDALVPVGHQIGSYLDPDLYKHLMAISPFYRANWATQIVQLQIALARDAITRNDSVTLQNVLEDGEDAGGVHLLWSHLFGTSPLCIAARIGTREIMETLLQYGTWHGGGPERAAMKIAIHCGNRAVLDAWLDPERLSRRSDSCPWQTFRTAFIEFARVGDMEMVEYLSGRCGWYWTDPSGTHFDVFMEAIRSGQLAVAEWILKLGWFEIEYATARFTNPKTALFVALHDCEPGVRVPMVRMLLSHGADPNELCPSVKGTPLQAAIRLNDPQLVHLLLDHGADASARTPGSIQRLRTRLRAPLLYAARRGDVQLVRKLFKHGANPLVVFRGRTLMDEAKAGRVEEVREMLFEFGWAEKFDEWATRRKVAKRKSA